MSTVGGVSGGGQPVDPRVADRLARLGRAAKQLEGLFVQQMFAAMRETVPHDGIVDGGNGEEMFTSMFDQKLAEGAPEQWQHGLSDAIVARLRGRLEPPAPTAPDGPAAPLTHNPQPLSHLSTPNRP
jgi:Rod binding domain-containing protein